MWDKYKEKYTQMYLNWTVENYRDKEKLSEATRWEKNKIMLLLKKLI